MQYGMDARSDSPERIRASSHAPASNYPGLYLHRYDSCGEAGWSLMSEGECERAARYRFQRDRSRYVQRTAFVRAVLARETGVEAGEIRLVQEAHGRPVLAHGAGAPAFSVSSSGDYCAVLVRKRGPVGVDLERIVPLPELQTMAAELLTPAEQRTLGGLPADQRLQSFFERWTFREALGKALGLGLDPSVTAIPAPDGRPTAVLEALGNRWRIHWQPLLSGYACCIVTLAEPGVQ